MCYVMVAGSAAPSTLHEFASLRWKATSISLYYRVMEVAFHLRLPVSSLVLRMDNSTIRIAVGLRLRSTLCWLHTCGAHMDSTATHGHSCRWSESHHHHQVAISETVHWAMSAAHLPSRLEPTGLFCSDGNALIASRWCPGRVADSLCGMAPGPTLLLLPT